MVNSHFDPDPEDSGGGEITGDEKDYDALRVSTTQLQFCYK